jgi:hypothetical protein
MSATAGVAPRTIVVKVGTSSILRGDTGTLALSTLASLVETLSTMVKNGDRVVLVSSGAVGVGCQRMRVKERPKGIAELQAMAAIGQPHLMRYYDELFSALDQPIAQVRLIVQRPAGLASAPFVRHGSPFACLRNPLLVRACQLLPRACARTAHRTPALLALA